MEIAVQRTIREDNLSELIKLLKGGSVDVKLQSGWTPLLHACSFGNYSIVSYLLNHGAKADLAFELFTPLMAICDSSSFREEELVECVRALLQCQVSVDAMDKYKCTALMYACGKGHEGVVSVLLTTKCDVNKICNEGQSALHMACMYSHTNIVRLLLDHGADKNIKDRRSRRPIDLAMDRGAKDIIELLDEGMIENSSEDQLTYIRKKTAFEELLQELPCYNNLSCQEMFHNDVETLLAGVRLQTLLELVLKKRVSFARFLNLTNEELKNLGVYFSSHREKIITGNKRFVLQPWAPSSLPDLNPGSTTVIDLIDIVRSLANSVKQLHILWASTVYCDGRVILPTDKEDRKVNDFYEMVFQTHRQTKALIKELKLIQEQVDHLERVDKVKQVDLIRPIKHSKYPSFSKVFLLSTGFALLVWKSNMINILRK